MDYENQGVFKTLLVFAMDEGFDHLVAAFGGLWHGLIMPFFSKSVTYVVVQHAFFCVMILGVGGGVGGGAWGFSESVIRLLVVGRGWREMCRGDCIGEVYD